MENTDALILIMEWKTFRRPDFKRMGQVLKEKIIFNGRKQ
jgi:UDPglucose 6-dehydrogenase